jgi:hypothetical protein
VKLIFVIPYRASHIAKLTTLLLALAISPLQVEAQTSRKFYGRFEGNLVLVPEKNGLAMRLLQRYAFIDASGGVWEAPAGTVSDGASIPKAAKSFVGGSWDGLYRDAAVIHDVACDRKDRPWELVHLTFYHAMLAKGVPVTTAKVMYAAVYHFGPRWSPMGRGMSGSAPPSSGSIAGTGSIGNAGTGTTTGTGITGAAGNGTTTGAGSTGTTGTGTNDLFNTTHSRASEVLSNERIFEKMAQTIQSAEKKGRGLTLEQIENLN